MHRHKGKSCGYYVKLIFFFSSLIQSLIIVSLVLFLIYGQPEKTAEEKRVKELELNFNHLGEINIGLRKDKADLTAQLGARTAEKGALEKELETVKTAANITQVELKKKQDDCNKLLMSTRSMLGRCSTTPVQPSIVLNPNSEVKTLQSLNAQQKAMMNLIEANFTQTVLYLSQERDTALKDRDTHHQEAITMRKENNMLKDQLIAYTRKCKEDFAHSLDGIKTVTSEFLNKINNLFPHQLTFHLSCASQTEQMEKIRNSCTNLSNDVENKFQIYLDRVGDKVAQIQLMSSRLEVQNTYINSDLKKCEQTRKDNDAQARQELELKQQKHDNQLERLLMEQTRLREQKKLQEDSLALKENELKSVKANLANCKPGGGLMAPAMNKPPSVGSLGISKTPTVR